MSYQGCLVAFCLWPLLIAAWGRGFWHFVVAFTVTVLLPVAWKKRTRRAYCLDVAAALDLTRHRKRFLKVAIDSGSFHGFSVVLTDLHTNRLGSAERLQVVIGNGRESGIIPPTLVLEQKWASSFPGLDDREDAITGDPEFDGRVRVSGGDATALAVLPPEARTDFLTLGRANHLVRVADGRVTLEIFHKATKEEAVDQVRTALKLAQRLVLPADGVVAGLARRAVEDRHPGVRLRAFTILASGDQPVEIVANVARKLVEDPHPEVRMRAAMALGEEGFEYLSRLVLTLLPRSPFERDGHAGTEVAPQADDNTPAEVLLLRQADERAAAAAHEECRALALAHLVSRQKRERVLPLVKEALRASGPLRVAALVAVTKIGDASLEAEMIAAHESDVPQVRVAAIEALGAIGTAAAVPHLRAQAERSGPLDFELRRTVDEAVAKIQARLQGAAAGQVALADAESGSAAGRVSLMEDGAAGRVALAPDPPGQ